MTLLWHSTFYMTSGQDLHVQPCNFSGDVIYRFCETKDVFFLLLETKKKRKKSEGSEGDIAVSFLNLWLYYSLLHLTVSMQLIVPWHLYDCLGNVKKLNYHYICFSHLWFINNKPIFIRSSIHFLCRTPNSVTFYELFQHSHINLITNSWVWGNLAHTVTAFKWQIWIHAWNCESH